MQATTLLIAVRNNPKTVTFDELDKLLRQAGYERRQPLSGSSHYVYRKGNRILTVPEQSPYVKAVYVKLALSVLGGGSRVVNDDLKRYVQVPYRIEIYPAEEGGYVAAIPDLPGCVTQGERREEVLRRIEDAKTALKSKASASIT